MNTIPIVDVRAFGTVSILGSRLSAPVVRLERRIGQASPDKARTYYEGVRRNYSNLVLLMGKEAADIALEEARRAL